jgi:prepilin-type N-terminal cleavage/methylation domain-containing protein
MILKQPTPGTRRTGAFTLVEVLVSVVVLAVIATAFYSGLSSGFSVVQTTREDLRATQILMQKVEALRLCTWEQLTNVSFQELYDPVSTNKNGATYFGTIVTNSASAIPNSSSYQSNVCLVTVTLSWTNYSGRRLLPHTRQMQTQVARYGMQNYIWGAQ